MYRDDMDGLVFHMHRRSSFISMVVFGVRDGNVYRMRGQTMHTMVSRSREMYVEEKVDPLVVRKVAPLVA
jgi:hypothetical protein